MMTDDSNLIDSLATAWPPNQWRDLHVVVAISGGRDSVALLVALQRLNSQGKGTIRAAHLNHGLRGDESKADQRFVKKLCATLNVPIEVGQADVATAAQMQGDGIEAAARAARYGFLVDVAHRCGARYLATAHTADDQVETVLHRIVRGTGIGGLTGMAFARPIDDGLTLVRPLLGVRRAEIDQFLAAENIAFRDDSSNADPQFTRNRLRQDLLPKLRADYNPSVDDALLRLAHLAQECQAVIDPLVNQLIDLAVRMRRDVVSIDCRKLAGCSRYLIRELLLQLWRTAKFPRQAMGKQQWDVLADMVAVDSGDLARDFPGPVRANKKGGQLTLTRL